MVEKTELLITMDGGVDELLALLGWIKGNDEFAGQVGLRRAAVRPGQMGSVLDAITVVVGSGGALSGLIGTVAVWMRNRGAKISVEVARGDRVVTITGDRVREAELTQLQAMAVELAQQLDDD